MLRNGVARQLIGNIPTYMGGLDILPCRGDHKKLVEIIPVQGHLVDYNSDVWDFTPGFKYQRRCSLRVKFGKADPQFKNLLKDFAVQKLDSYEWKVSTACNDVSMMTTVLNSAIENSSHGLFILIDTDDIIGAVEATQAHMGSRRNAFAQLMAFAEFIREHHAIVLPVDLDIIGREMVYLGDKTACNGTRRHHKNVPEELFQAIVETADRVMRDEKQPFNMRMTAGMVLLDTQLGLRCSEIPALEKNCVFDYTCGDGVIRHYTVYNCIKAAKADVEVLRIVSICTDIFYDTWKYMLELREKCQYKDMVDFMYVVEPNSYKHDENGKFPVSLGSFLYMYKTFFGRYMRSWIKKDWKGIERVRIPNVIDGSSYSIPTIHSLRVHFATSLYRQGFPLDFIESIMSHTPQSNTYDSYYDVDDEEFRKAQQSKYTNKPQKYANPDEEFDAFMEEIDDDQLFNDYER